MDTSLPQVKASVSTMESEFDTVVRNIYVCDFDSELLAMIAAWSCNVLHVEGFRTDLLGRVDFSMLSSVQYNMCGLNAQKFRIEFQESATSEI